MVVFSFPVKIDPPVSVSVVIYTMKVHPFDKTLSRKVLSDHAEIAVQAFGMHFVSAYNISNPTYHRRFGDKPAFKDTHLYVDEPYGPNNKLEAGMEAKIETQVESITDGIYSGGVPVNVIVEGYTNFYERIHRDFKRKEFTDYTMIVAPEENPYKNRTAIIVNTRLLPVLESGVIQREYVSTEDNNLKKKLTLPHVLLANGTRIVGVHVNGCQDQHPVSGIRELKEALHSFKETKILALGDFNTNPVNVDSLGFDVLVPDYPTHVNPFGEACYYDYALVKGIENCSMCEIDMMTDSSQDLVEAILRSRK